MEDEITETVKSSDRTVVSQKVLFVRNLPFSTTDQDLENLFSEVGPIKRCFVIRDKGEMLCTVVHVGTRLQILVSGRVWRVFFTVFVVPTDL